MLIDLIVMIFPLIFTSNLVMSVVKIIAQGSMSNVYLRGVLAIFAVLGVIVASALTGDPVNFDSIIALLKVAGDAAIVVIGAHISYKVIKNS